MGPFVPHIISDQLNLIVALFIGIAFGFVLEQAGFSSSRRLAGLFYGYDFTVLRVFFTAAVTAMSGMLLLGYFGLLDLDAIYVNPTWLKPAIVGGAIMGFGFILGGYCPGTSICAAAIGKVDAMFFVLGGLLGVFAFAELFPAMSAFYESTALGPIRVYDALGISAGVFALILIAVAVTAFAVTTWIERKVNPDAPSRAFSRRPHWMAGIAALLLGLVLVAVPERKAHLMEMVADPAYQAEHPVQVMTADELAFRIVDREPRLRIVDLRTAGESQQSPLPGAVNMTESEFFGRTGNALLEQRHMQKVLVATDERQARSAYLLLKKLGYENLAVLEGGLPEFQKTILDSSAFVSTGSRWENDVRDFREQARTQLRSLIEQERNKGQSVAKPAKKVSGGC